MTAWGCSAAVRMGRAVRESPMGPVGPWPYYLRRSINFTLHLSRRMIDDLIQCMTGAMHIFYLESCLLVIVHDGINGFPVISDEVGHYGPRLWKVGLSTPPAASLVASHGFWGRDALPEG